MPPERGGARHNTAWLGVGRESCADWSDGMWNTHHQGDPKTLGRDLGGPHDSAWTPSSPGPVCFLSDMSFITELLHRWTHFLGRPEPSSAKEQFPLIDFMTRQQDTICHMCHPEMLLCKHAGPQGSATLYTWGREPDLGVTPQGRSLPERSGSRC